VEVRERGVGSLDRDLDGRGSVAHCAESGVARWAEKPSDAVATSPLWWGAAVVVVIHHEDDPADLAIPPDALDLALSPATDGTPATLSAPEDIELLRCQLVLGVEEPVLRL
jgi:hypothetical protein